MPVRTAFWILVLPLWSAATLAGEARQILAEFENSDKCGFELKLGAEFPGAQGNFVIDTDESHGGESSAWLDASFAEGGAYVALVRTFAEPLPAQRVSFWIKAPGIEFVVFRIVDSTGQTHQQRLKLQDTAAWQQVTITNFLPRERGALHFGGANDGQWHGPAKGLSLILDKGSIRDRTRKAGKIWLDDIELVVEN